MRKSILFLIGLMLLAGYAENIKMEVRIYYGDNFKLTNTLGNLLNDLDVVTIPQTFLEKKYLTIITTPEQLRQIQAEGIEASITYADIRDKIYAITGVKEPKEFRDFGYFYTYWEMCDSLQAWAIQYPDICRLFTVGKSHQGLDLLACKISDNPKIDEDEPATLFTSAAHAREPMGVTLCMDYIKYLLTNYTVDSFVKWLVNNREIYFLPVVNPDGYRYNSDSGGVTANWRKNRRVVQAPYIGVDLDRNYGYRWAWDDRGSSPNPSSETYRGPSRFSEVETQALRDFMLGKKIRTNIDYHSYGGFNCCVWGYSRNFEPIPDSIIQWEILDSMRSYNGYISFPLAQNIPSNGVAIDWSMADTFCNSIRKFVTFAYVIITSGNDFWEGWNDTSVINRNIRQNRPVNIYFTKIAGVFFDWLRPVIADTMLGNGTGQLDPGERSHLWFFVRNRSVHGLDSAYNISARLLSLDTMIVVETANANFPTIQRNSPGDNRASRFIIRCSPNAPPGSRKGLRLEMTFKNDTCTIIQAVTCS
ncbi:MAG: M14 family metallopeptidase, partial [candidate division WOR-3 bacterium]